MSNTETVDLRYCPACLDGEVWLLCAGCQGAGCDACGLAGEVLSPDACALCGGSGQLSFVTIQLWEINRRVSRYDDGKSWNGDPWKHEGTTDYSGAAYWRRREELRSKVARVVCRQDGSGNLAGVVELRAANFRLLADYPGFAWGYGGEGPHGLALLIADLWPGRYPTLEAALRIVGRHPMNSEWELVG